SRTTSVTHASASITRPRPAPPRHCSSLWTMARQTETRFVPANSCSAAAAQEPSGLVRPYATDVFADLLDEAHLGFRLQRRRIQVHVLDGTAALAGAGIPKRLAEWLALRILEQIGGGPYSCRIPAARHEQTIRADAEDVQVAITERWLSRREVGQRLLPSNRRIVRDRLGQHRLGFSGRTTVVRRMDSGREGCAHDGGRQPSAHDALLFATARPSIRPDASPPRDGTSRRVTLPATRPAIRLLQLWQVPVRILGPRLRRLALDDDVQRPLLVLVLHLVHRPDHAGPEGATVAASPTADDDDQDEDREPGHPDDADQGVGVFHD